MAENFFKVGEKQGSSGRKYVKRQKVGPEDCLEDPKLNQKYRNILKFQNDRELGVIAGVQAEKEYYKMKISHREKISFCNLAIPYRYESCEVSIIKGDEKSLFGMWRLCDNHGSNSYVRGEMHHSDNDEDYYKECNNITDMCRVSTDFIVIPNYPSAPPPSFFSRSNVLIQVKEEYCPPPWHCCCYIPRSDAALFGGDGYMFVLRGKEHRNHYANKYSGKVCTVSYHIESRKLLTALDTGIIGLQHFVRGSKERPWAIKISDKAVNDSVFLNGHEVIVTDVEGKLVKVDLRTRKISAMFFGHKHSVTKRPLSVANNMLCATGVDNAVRIWHVSGGHPIHVQKSASGCEVRGWISSHGSNTYLNYFERDTRTLYTI